jgi:hypothetical protein
MQNGNVEKNTTAISTVALVPKSCRKKARRLFCILAADKVSNDRAYGPTNESADISETTSERRASYCPYINCSQPRPSPAMFRSIRIFHNLSPHEGTVRLPLKALLSSLEVGVSLRRLNLKSLWTGAIARPSHQALRQRDKVHEECPRGRRVEAIDHIALHAGCIASDGGTCQHFGFAATAAKEIRAARVAVACAAVSITVGLIMVPVQNA